MLKGINPKISADLIGILAAMGHGDELVICDRNYPALSHSSRLVNYQSSNVEEVLSLVLTLFPLDTFVVKPIVRMEVVGDANQITDGQDAVHKLAMDIEKRNFGMDSLPRHEFYERASKAYATVATGDGQPYGCFILIKGVI
jgi:L-fucose mutarotase